MLGYRIGEWRYTLEWQNIRVSYCGVEVQLGVAEYYCIVLRSGGEA